MARVHPLEFNCKSCGQHVVLGPEGSNDRRRDYCSKACKLKAFWAKNNREEYRKHHQYKPSLEATARARERQRLKAVARREQRAPIIEKQKQETARRREAARLAAALEAVKCVCRICGTAFQKTFLRRNKPCLCSIECRRAAERESRREARKKHGRDSKYRHRAKRFGVDYAPGISVGKVFERDGWRCQLCGCATPKRLRGKNRPNSPELDHIIPLSAGGGHTWGNVQCACRECNGKKGANTLGQFRLNIEESITYGGGGSNISNK